MKLSAAVVLIGLIASTSACSSKSHHGSVTAVKADQKSADPAPFALPTVKYPAAIVFEGGTGNAFFDVTGANHTAKWRLYLCLQKTDRPISGQVILDFAKLGNGQEVLQYEQSAVTVKQLSSVVLNYSYTAELSADPAANDGYAYGDATVNLQPETNWVTVFHSASDVPASNSMDLDVFKIQTLSGSLISYQQDIYVLGKQSYYISSSLDRFTFSQNDRTSHVIEACERQDKPYFFEVGDEIK